MHTNLVYSGRHVHHVTVVLGTAKWRSPSTHLQFRRGKGFFARFASNRRTSSAPCVKQPTIGELSNPRFVVLRHFTLYSKKQSKIEAPRCHAPSTRGICITPELHEFHSTLLTSLSHFQPPSPIPLPPLAQ